MARNSAKGRVRLAYAVSHPIQYQAPLLRRIAREPGIDLTVFYSSDFSARGYTDRGFGRRVEWDIPLLGGYKHEVLPRFPGTSNISSAQPPSYGYMRAFLRGRFDAVWVHGYATANSLHALLAARAMGAQTLLRTDSTLGDRSRGPSKRALRSAFFVGLSPLIDTILTCGSLNARYWSAMLPHTRQVLMPYAVDNSYFSDRAQQSATQREQMRRQLGIRPEDKVFLYAAKLIARKRCADLLEAFTRLRHPNARLLIAGDGEERAALEARAREIFPDFGTENWPVRFLGFRNQREIPQLLNLCDVFVLPSVHEPWGLIVNEAMACGRCVLVSNEVGCAPDLVLEGKTGFVVPALDPQALCEAMRTCVTVPGLTENMGRAAERHIREWDFEADVSALRRALRLA